MGNSQMIAGRFLRWHKARQKVAWMAARIAEGRTVLITTHLRQVRLTAKHAAMIKATKTGAYVQRGKTWNCIDYCKISAV